MTLRQDGSTRFSDNFAVLPPAILERIVVTASDLCLLVTQANIVADITRGGALDDVICDDWLDQPLQNIVRKDSLGKLGLLWSAYTEGTPIWRHLNFKLANDTTGDGVPLLVRRIALDDGRSVMICRDLRPSVKMQRTFNRALHEITQSFEDSYSRHDFHAPNPHAEKTVTSIFRGRMIAAVDRAMDDIGKLPLNEIVSQTSHVLEDICIQLAYKQCHYDLLKTAEMLGVNSDELAARLAFAP